MTNELSRETIALLEKVAETCLAHHRWYLDNPDQRSPDDEGLHMLESAFMILYNRFVRVKH